MTVAELLAADVVAVLAFVVLPWLLGAALLGAGVALGAWRALAALARAARRPTSGAEGGS